MTRHKVFAPAKINLTLHVTGQRADGYHLLDSFVVFANIGDQLTLTQGAQMALSVSGPHAAGVPCDAGNLVWRAAEISGWTGQIELVKTLPHGAGIGGGSADAAAVLRALNGAADPVALGADVPVCVLSRAARMAGIGDSVVPVAHAPSFHAVLVNPGVHVATPQVFSELAAKSNAAMQALPPASANGADWITWLAAQRNDLEAPALECAPVIGDVLAALRGTDEVLLARMSGSGATCVALYPNADHARAAAGALAAAHPAWWCVDTVLS